MLVKCPLKLVVPACGVLAAESMHDVRFKMPPERHAFHEIYYVLKGRALYFESGVDSPVVLAEGVCYPISAGVSHRLEDQQQATMLLLCFSVGFLDAAPARRMLWEGLVSRTHRSLVTDDITQAQLERSLRTIMAEQEGGRLGAEVVIESEGLKVLAILGRLPDDSVAASAHERVATIVALVTQNYFELWNLDTAARCARLSRRRFSTLFRAVTGKTFVDYLTDLRLARAAALLRQGKRSIAGTAFAVGFNDLSHFYRVFRARYGTTPGRWAEGSEGD